MPYCPQTVKAKVHWAFWHWGSWITVERCSRYVDVDLNRCFTSATLSAPLTEDSPYEVKRAQELNSNLGPKGTAQAADLLCDLHNTTANMGVCLIGYSDSDWLSLQFYKYLQMKMSHVPVRFLIFNLPPSESYSLESVGKHGFAIEVGPQPQGVLRADIFIQMKEGITHLLDFIELFNTGTVFPSCEVDMYRSVGNIDYPRDPRTQHIAAAVHPDRQVSLISAQRRVSQGHCCDGARPRSVTGQSGALL
nr:PREDICTED: N-acyl-aromatic-L-amino acid amidohydrolase (carboxylate-forming) A-like [Lepisosteus oculatus]